jgi:hypothetical protein
VALSIWLRSSATDTIGVGFRRSARVRFARGRARFLRSLAAGFRFTWSLRDRLQNPVLRIPAPVARRTRFRQIRIAPIARTGRRQEREGGLDVHRKARFV